MNLYAVEQNYLSLSTYLGLKQQSLVLWNTGREFAHGYEDEREMYGNVKPWIEELKL